jgi:hypothetical protein
LVLHTIGLHTRTLVCIEFQYQTSDDFIFISSYLESILSLIGADNLIPMELALKIASKIKAKEKFAVYVVIPLWPEGVPTTASVQEILFWQVLTK